MTINQIVLLLDIDRGFEASRHPATLAPDLTFLEKKLGWIELAAHDPHRDWRLTYQGQEVVKWLRKTFELMGC
ncbi:MAG: hypothetical protein ACXAC5_01825 [Promethearchaeota archaeon]|jgi:hypothetical protein